MAREYLSGSSRWHLPFDAGTFAGFRQRQRATQGPIYTEFASRKVSERQGLAGTRILGIDEHRRDRRKPELCQFFVDPKGRVIYMDLSSLYRALARLA